MPLFNPSGINNASVFNFSVGLGGSFSTGALGFTPICIMVSGSNANDKGSTGFATGTAAASQVSAFHGDTGQSQGTGNVLRNNGATKTMAVTAFSSAGVTLAESGLAGAETWQGVMMVLG